jgi:predicted Holliday junction resolvase-like endonuclease
MLKVLFELFLLYLLYKVVFDFIIPVYQTTKQVKQKVNKMQQDMNAHIQKQSNSQHTASPRQETTPGTKKNEDYIDFEEVK